MRNGHWLRNYTELAFLFLLQGMAMAIWAVPLGSMLVANGLGDLVGKLYATSGIAACISPLIFGSLADQRYPPIKILRFLALCTSAAMALVTTAIGFHWGRPAIAVLGQLHALCTSPTFGITTAVILARLRDAKHEFGPIRAMATFGWMVGCWLVSLIRLDQDFRVGYVGAAAWLGVAAFSLLIPPKPAPQRVTKLTWRQRLGFDALGLLKNKDVRTVFLAAAIYNVPLCAFYPYATKHLHDLGFQKTTALMTFGQISEIASLFLLGTLFTRWRLKWIFLVGIGFGVTRFVACALDSAGVVLLGITLHGFAYALFFITTQVFLDLRVPGAWRARAQALFTFMVNGLGNTVGYLGCDWWKSATTDASTHTDWTWFWGGLAIVVSVIWMWFYWSYRGRPGVDPALPGEPELPPGTPAEPPGGL